MRSAPARVGVAIVLSALVVVAAGCGGGSKNSTPGTTHSTTATIKVVSVPVSSGSGSSFASAKNCQDLAGLAAKVASAVSASSSSTTNPTTLLQTESNELHALAQAAPSDIRGDFQTFSTAFSGFLQALQKSGYKFGSKTPPTAAQIGQLTKAAQSFNEPKLRQAELHLQAWAKQNCKGVHVGG